MSLSVLWQGLCVSPCQGLRKSECVFLRSPWIGGVLVELGLIMVDTDHALICLSGRCSPLPSTSHRATKVRVDAQWRWNVAARSTASELRPSARWLLWRFRGRSVVWDLLKCWCAWRGTRCRKPFLKENKYSRPKQDYHGPTCWSVNLETTFGMGLYLCFLLLCCWFQIIRGLDV